MRRRGASLGRRRSLATALGVVSVVSCGTGIGRTFEPGVEHVPGPASIVVRIPPDATEAGIVLTGYGDEPLRLFPAHRGDDRFLTAQSLPGTLSVWVDGHRCDGSIDLLSDLEYDATLTVDRDSCLLRLDLRHAAGAIDHHLQDGAPTAS